MQVQDVVLVSQPDAHPKCMCEIARSPKPAIAEIVCARSAIEHQDVVPGELPDQL